MRQLNNDEIDAVSGGFGEFGWVTNNGISAFNERLFNMNIGQFSAIPTQRYIPGLSDGGGGLGFIPTLSDVEI